MAASKEESYPIAPIVGRFRPPYQRLGKPDAVNLTRWALTSPRKSGAREKEAYRAPLHPPHYRPARQREAHQHEGGGDLRTAHQNAGRGFHLVPLIAAERAMPAAFADTADNDMQRRRKTCDVGAEMAERDQRQRGVERVHFGGD